jgi:tetratricopeptide (TPR) repeat protein
MSNAAKLKKKAVELEQKKQFDKALALYIQFLQESEGSIDDADISLYNRVGDLMLRTGNASDALNYFEKAVDLYAERGFHNNAIALCNRVLRQAPGRASIYYKLGKISATKGFKSDAKKNFLEYADRMQKVGQIDEAFRALKEFADLCPDQDDIRLMLAEQLTKENRQDEALEQLQKLHDKLDSEGRDAEVRATVDRMKSIDPEAVPRVSGSYRPQKSTDLIFLDTSYEQAARSTKPGPVPAPRVPTAAAPRAPAPAAPRAPTPAAPSLPTPTGRQVSDPDLVVLTLGDQPDASVSAAENVALTDGFELDAPNANQAQGLPLLDVGDALPPLPSAEDLVAAFDTEAAASGAAESSPAPIDFEFPEIPARPERSFVELEIPGPVSESTHAGSEVAQIEPLAEAPTYGAGPSLAVDYASDLVADIVAPLEADGSDLFDFRSPPRSDVESFDVAPATDLDPDVAFPSFDLGDTALPSADEITGASLAAALGSESPLDADLGSLDVDLGGPPLNERADAESLAASLSDLPTSDVAEGLGLGWPATEEATVVDAAAIAEQPATGGVAGEGSELAASIDEMIVADAADSRPDSRSAVVEEPIVEQALALEAATLQTAEAPAASEDLIELSVDDLIETPNAIEEPRAASAAEATDIPLRSTGEREVVPAPAVDRRSSAPSKTVPHAAAEPQAPVERIAGWEEQRAQAERLLEGGDRAAGIQLLEQVSAELERIGDLERALTIVDELIRLSPDSIRHHQKRVELAFRSSDRAKLTDAYLELGDALFRSGEERKARAVYQRVLELAPDDPRARASVESVASMSPTASGSMTAIPAPPADVRQAPPARLPARDANGVTAHGSTNGARASNGIGAQPQSRKPSPLDRSAATNGEFVDLGEWLRSGESPKSTRMVAEEKPPTGDEQADFQEMLKRFKQGIAENVDEEDFESHYDLGVAYKEMGLIDEAVAEFQKALRGHTNRVRSYEALGQCFVEKGQYHVAASVLSRAIALGEGDDHHLVGVLYLLGRAKEELSRDRDALDYYQRVFAVDIEFRDVADRISAIERKAT